MREVKIPEHAQDVYPSTHGPGAIEHAAHVPLEMEARRELSVPPPGGVCGARAAPRAAVRTPRGFPRLTVLTTHPSLSTHPTSPPRTLRVSKLSVDATAVIGAAEATSMQMKPRRPPPADQ